MKFNSRYFLTGLKLALFSLLLTACLGGSKTFQNFGDQQANKPYCYKEINISFPTDTGNYLNIDIENNVKDEIIERLGQRYKREGNSCGLLNMEILNYTAGSSIGRWFLPGAGETKLTIAFSIIDSDGLLYNKIYSKETISAGGLFTIGQSTLVVGDVIENVIHLL